MVALASENGRPTVALVSFLDLPPVELFRHGCQYTRYEAPKQSQRNSAQALGLEPLTQEAGISRTFSGSFDVLVYTKTSKPFNISNTG